MYLIMLLFVVLGSTAGSSTTKKDVTFQPFYSKYQAIVNRNGRRYRLSANKANQREATLSCVEDNAILAIIKSPDATESINKMLDDRLNGKFDKAWIGLNLARMVSGTWSDNTSYDHDIRHTYSNWAQNEPESPRYTSCVVLWGKKNWNWDDVFCDEEYNYICEDKDPQSYTLQDVLNLKNAIVQLAKRNVTSLVLGKLTNLLDKLLEVNQTLLEQSRKLTPSILQTIETILEKYNISMESFTDKAENLEINIKNLRKLSNTSNVVFGESLADHQKTASSIILSQELLEEAQHRAGSAATHINSVVYRIASLFASKSETIEENKFQFGEAETHVFRDIVSHVISVGVQNVRMENLTTPVIIRHLFSKLTVSKSNLTYVFDNSTINSSSSFKVLPQSLIRNVFTEHSTKEETYLKCVFWDFNTNNGDGGWSDKGCRFSSLSFTDDMIDATCTCNHMTNFAVILDTSIRYQPKYLTYITILGCGISIVCLLTTFVINFCHRQLRAKTSQQVLMHICFSLLFLNGIFLFGIDRTDDEMACLITAALLHYAVLLSWSWMLAEGVYLNKTISFSRLNSGKETWFIWVASAFCYSIPAVVVATTVSLAVGYRSKRYCWISGDMLLYALVYPVGFILLINILLFAIIMYNITFRSPMFRKKLNLKKIRHSLRRAACMMFVLGLPWIFGYLMVLSKNDEAKNTFSIIFTSFNAVQGLAIFVLYCIVNENVRAIWLTSLEKLCRSGMDKARNAPFTGWKSTLTFSQNETSMKKNHNIKAHTGADVSTSIGSNLSTGCNASRPYKKTKTLKRQSQRSSIFQSKWIEEIDEQV